MTDTLIIWAVELMVVAILDTRKDIFQKLITYGVWAFSIYVTYETLGIMWLILPFLIIPIIGGILGGVGKGLYQRQKEKANHNKSD